MAPTKVGFIGLSASGWARVAHLPYLKESGEYEIVAICNSSVESSEAAIKQYGLPPSTKAYGDPEGPSPSKLERCLNHVTDLDWVYRYCQRSQRGVGCVLR